MNLSTLDLANCIYLDIEALAESNPGHIPVPFFAGTYSPSLPGKERYKVSLIADAWCSGLPPIRHSVEISELKKVFAGTIAAAKRQGGKIISWSDYESQACKAYAPELFDEFDSLNINFLPVAKAFIESVSPDRVDTEAMRLLASYVNCDHPEYSVVENVRNESGLDDLLVQHAGLEWNIWPDKQKDRFRNVIEYNYIDCQELPNFVKLVAQAHSS